MKHPVGTIFKSENIWIKRTNDWLCTKGGGYHGTWKTGDTIVLETQEKVDGFFDGKFISFKDYKNEISQA